jgi:hypothetical protein
MLRLVCAAALAGLLVACGGEDERAAERPERPRIVTGTVDLERPPAGAPDAGTSGGHRAPDAIASTARTSLTIRGTVKPAQSRVVIRDGDTRREETARVEAGGRFVAEAANLRPGPNAFVIEGRARGHRPWSIDVSITRR